jgi:hypothetical protein
MFKSVLIWPFMVVVCSVYAVAMATRHKVELPAPDIPPSRMLTLSAAGVSDWHSKRLVRHR